MRGSYDTSRFAKAGNLRNVATNADAAKIVRLAEVLVMASGYE